jgi:Ca2+-binding RTX toxin-like protein
MSTNAQATLAAQASNASYKYGADAVPPPGYTLATEIGTGGEDRNGFHAIVWVNGSGDYIVGIAGTEPSTSDGFNNANLARPQYESSTGGKELLAWIRAEVPSTSSLHVTGHSAGGAIGQYLIYDLARDVTRTGQLALTTFNALGGEMGARQMHGENFDPNRLQSVNVTNYTIATDAVTLLGGGHLGGNVMQIDVGATSPLAAHGISNFLGVDFSQAVSVSPNYLNVTSGQAIAALMSGLGNEGQYTETEAGMRLLGGLTIAVALAPSSEINQLVGAILPQHAGGPWGQIRNAAIGMFPGFTGSVMLSAAAIVAAANISQSYREQSAALSEWTSAEIDQLSEAAREISAVAKTAYEDAKSYGPEALDVVSTAYDQAISNAADVIGDLVEGYDQAVDYTADKIEEAVAFYDDAVNWTADRIADLAETFGVAEKALLDFSEGFKEAYQEVKEDLLSDGLGALKDWVNRGVDALRELASRPDNLPSNDENGPPNDLLPNLQRDFENAERTRSPLVLDLDGDGVETIGLSTNVHFDHDANQFAEGTGWVGQDDGLLVWDRNGNGKIDNGRELFGNGTQLGEDLFASNGFTALAALDSNQDGKIDSADAFFANLRVWKDSDGNGVSSSDELLSLASAGVESLSFAYLDPGAPDANGDVSSEVVDVNGNEHRQLGSYTRTDGTTAAMADVWFAFNGADTVAMDLVDVTGAIAALPDVQGFGNVHGLRQAMVRDSSGVLQGLVEEYLSTTDPQPRRDALLSLMYEWAGVADVDPESRTETKMYGNVIGDARKLATLEAFLGVDYLGTWCWGERDPNPHGGAAPGLLRAFERLADYVAGTLDVQMRLKSYYEMIAVTWDQVTSSFVLDVSELVAALQSMYNANQGSALALMSELSESMRFAGEFGSSALQKVSSLGDGESSGFLYYLGTFGHTVARGTDQDDTIYGIHDASNYISALAGNDWVTGGIYEDTLTGDGGNDFLYGDGGNDILGGGADDDTLYGGAGNDVLDGQSGNDYLDGGVGDDIYNFGRGGGQDSIFDNDFTLGNIDTVVLTEGVATSDVEIWRDASNLYLRILGGNDLLTMQGWYDIKENRIEAISFFDGTIWEVPILASADYFGTADSDTMLGSIENDFFQGLAGDDGIQGGFGDDTLDGGTGDDYLDGGAGDDTYVFSTGYGHDTINDSSGVDVVTLGPGLTPIDVTVWRDQYHLYLQINGTNDLLTVTSWFDSVNNRVESIQFADGSIWTTAVLANAPFLGTQASDSLSGTVNNDTLRGFGGVDYLDGYSGNDVLDGGTGNDNLNGGDGDDAYIFDLGFGQDTIVDASGIDVIRFGSGIASTDVKLWRDTSNLYVGIIGAADMLTVTGWFDATSNRIESVEFADGTIWNALTLSRTNFAATEGADSLFGSEGDDVLAGADGNDALYGYGGADTLDGGTGNDILEGGDGNDTYLFDVGYGQDTIADSAGIDTIRLGSGVTPQNVKVWRDVSNLYVGVVGAPDVLTVTGWFDAIGSRVESLQFEDGSVWGETVLAVATYVGTESGDTMTGAAGDDHLEGNGGDDTLTGDLGNDILDGGTGSDSLDGGAGDDTYIFDLGYGQDSITDASGTDVIKLGAGLTPENVQIWRDTSNLYLQVTGTSDLLTVTGWFDTTANRVEGIQFADNTIWNTATLAAAKFVGTEGGDGIYGTTGNDVLEGRGGDDAVSGDLGNDTLDGGAGNDSLDGGAGDDTYIFGLGYGQDSITDASGTDVIKLGAGLTPENVHIWRDTSNLYLQISGTNDVLTVTGWFDATTNRVESVQFADGSTWTTALLADAPFFGAQTADSLSGTASNDSLKGFGGDDYLDGYAGNDVLDGGTGNDNLNGGDGDDAYLFDLGFGQDTIVDALGTDVIRFGNGIAATDITLWRDTSNLYIGIVGSADFLTVTGWFDATSNRVESVEFSDGTIWNALALSRANFVATEGADSLHGSEGDDVLFGAGGNDSLHGYGGADTLDGGSGSDTLEGGDGNDTYLFDVGYGQDTITDSSGADVIKLGLGITPQNVKVWRDASHLYVGVVGTLDVLTVTGWFDATDSRVESLQFEDGSVWGEAVLAVARYVGTESGDTLTGSAGNDHLEGNGGDDTLTGDLGNDILDGGTGSDSLDGGAGDDTYVFGLGYGQDIITDISGADIIKLGAGLTPENVQIWRDTSNLYLQITGTNDLLTVTGWFDSTANRVESIQFADNTTWNTATLAAAKFAGTSGDDYITGTAGNDTIDGGAGHDTLDGGAGNDTYIFGLGYGQDSITDASGTDVIKLGTGLTPENVQIWRDTSNLYLQITGTSDVLTVTGWFDATTNRVESIQFADNTIWNAATLAAAKFVGTEGGDAIYGTTGNDVLEGRGGDDSLSGDLGNDTLDGGTGNDYLDGGAGNDSYIFDIGYGLDSITDSAGTDVVKFGAGVTPANVQMWRDTSNLYVGIIGTNDLLTITGWFDATANRVESFLFADSTVWNTATLTAAPFGGTAGADTLYGTTGHNTLYGFGGNDSLYADAGNDILDGGTGNDILDGAAGNDTYIFGRGYGQDVIYESAGTDIIQFNADTAAADVVVSRDASNLYLTIQGTQDKITVQNFYAATSYQTEQVKFSDGTIWTTAMLNTRMSTATEAADFLWGTTANNTFNGLGGNDLLFGNEGNDVLNGGDGDDLLNGGTGNDTMAGGTGDDVYVVDSISDVVTENTAEGTDTVQSSITLTLASNVENLALTGAAVINGTGNALDNVITGNSADNVLTGAAGNDTLNGGEGNDTLDGGVGDDVMAGGLGNDIYVVDSTADVVSELLGEGSDTVQSSISYVLGANVEKLTLTGTAATNGTGNELANTLVGNSAANTLDGGAGNDSLNGGAGADTLIGGLGNDSYNVDNVGDVVVENEGEGTDTVTSSISYVLGEHVERLTLSGSAALSGTGNSLDNILNGNSGANSLSGGAGNDIIDGKAGADTMTGGIGDDSYVVDNVGDAVIESLAEGTDSVTSSITYTLTANVENLKLSGTAAINGTGNELGNVLTGNSAINILDGGAGADTLIGGLGDDMYLVDDAGDVIVEEASEGVDTVQSTATEYVLSANLERLTLMGSADISGTGNDLDNLMTGNSEANTLNGAGGNDTLDGGAGADTLIGGLGNDTYLIDNSADVIIEAENEGLDVVQSSVTYVLSAHVENITLTGAAAINATGNASDNVIVGNTGVNILVGGDGNDTLDGKAGADTMLGGAGNDTYTVDNIGDVVTEYAAEGIDLVNSSVTYTLGANVENLTLTGSAAINATGNAEDNILTGNSGANVLVGGDGNDTLDGKAGADNMAGGLGNDIYFVDNVNDVVTELADQGIDTVNSSIAYVLGGTLENLTLTGSGAVSGTGNALDNILTGNSGVNTLTGGAGNDTLDGKAGADTLIGGLGDDVYVVDNAGDIVTENAGEGLDQVRSTVAHTLAANVEVLVLTGTSSVAGTGNAGDNMLHGNTGNNALNGGAGNDILQGGAGTDTLTDTDGNNLLDGGAGTDTLTGGAGNDFLIGGAGNDTINTGTGFDIIAFNRGDGMDNVNLSTGSDNTLSLGGGITYADLLFKKSSNDLILVTGTNEQVTFKGWYTSTDNRSVANLQIVIEGTSDYAAGSSDLLANKKIEQFDFGGLVTKFDQARTANPALTNWALSSSLLEFYLNSSDTAAIGGDLAYQYAKSGNLSDVSMAPAQALLAGSSFGSGAQNLQASSALQDLSPRLI